MARDPATRDAAASFNAVLRFTISSTSSVVIRYDLDVTTGIDSGFKKNMNDLDRVVVRFVMH